MNFDSEQIQPDEDLIEAFLLGHCTPEAARAMEERISVDPALRARVLAAEARCKAYRKIMRTAMEGEASANALSEDRLARYLDGSLSAGEREETEEALLTNPDARDRLVALYREVKSVLDPGYVVQVVERHAEGSRIDLDAARRELSASEVPESAVAESVDEGRDTLPRSASEKS